ncbi:MAG: hypothetical protein HOP12_11950 [Candidatus Eisenbacteria bacterium]|uniref:Uncharacterized protein n=1 Tax=Eiseniibacteriota bacterium TaxID=2212470 RepID=A0A849SPP3_UNCEI|nr:hypothetical protein [Candidatus Eisenbacteria bacterium]
MRYRFSLAATLTMIAALAATTAFAAKPAPEITELQGQTLESVQVGPPRTGQATCQLGVTGAAAFNINYLLPPNDEYFTLIDPASCGCANGAVQLNNINIALQFPVACTQPVQISVVGASGDAACYFPNPASVICQPVNYNLAPGAAGSFLFTMALAPGCCVSGPVFIRVSFVSGGVGCNTSATIPRLITTAACVPCTSYNIYPGGNDELCDVGFPGNPIMFSDADCCGATPTKLGSWGGLKINYR